MIKNILQKLFNPSASGKIRLIFVLIILLAFGAGLINAGKYYNKAVDWTSLKTNNYISLPRTKEIGFRLGLDLQGGTHLVYEADVSVVETKDRDDAAEGVRDVIERRVNVFGVSEPIIQVNKTTTGEYRIIAELAGIDDVSKAISMIGETPLLEFKEKSTEQRELKEEEKKIIEDFNKESDKKAEEALGKLISGGDFGVLASEYSDDEISKNNNGDLGWITEQNNPEIVNIAKNFEKGNFTKELVQTYNGYKLVKLEDKRVKINLSTNEEEKEVEASHLLICFKESQGCESELSKEEAFEKIKKLKEEATSDNFVELVKANSTEPGASERKGSLGWFAKGQMVKEFEDTVFSMNNKEISDIVETQFGYHLIYKQNDRSLEEYNIKYILIRKMTPEDILGIMKDWKNTELTGKNLNRAIVQFNPNDNIPEVSLEFDSEGAKFFEEITERNIGEQVAIYLDGYPVSVPTVNEKITGGKAVISGSFNVVDAKLLARRLNAGALPVPIELVEQKTVGASLGRLSVESSIKAGIIGFILVAVFMMLYYRLYGLFAVLSLLIYGMIVMAIFKIWPITLTLSGLAGFILSVGMAVDANVLIFERLKEELKYERPLRKTIDEAFRRAWASIRDGNYSTLITCFILIQFTTSIVRGFAITLAIGILVSMFSAIVITKNLMLLTAGKRLENNKWLLGIKSKTKF